MKKYTCEKCWWIEEQPDTYPQNVFQWAIEAHTNHILYYHGVRYHD